MNQNIPENFNLIKALNYLKKNDKSQSFTLKDIKNEENYFYNKLNNSKPTIIQTKLFHRTSIATPTNSTSSGKTNITDFEIQNYNKNSKNSFQFEEKNNLIDNNFNNDEFLENKKKINYNNENETSSLKHKRNMSQSSKTNKKVKTLNYKKNLFYEEPKSQICQYSNLTYNSQRSPLTRINSFNFSSISKENIKIEDIIFISERIDAILKKLNHFNLFDDLKNEGCCQECFEYLNFYFDSSLIENYTNYFNNVHYVIIKSSNNLELFSVILTYFFSLNSNIFISFKSILGKIFPLIKNNFMLIIKKIINDIYNNEDEEYLQQNNIYLNKINQIVKYNIPYIYSEQKIITIVIENSKKIVDFLKIILEKYQKQNKIKGSELIFLFNNISKLSNSTLNEFFYEKILYIPDEDGSIINTFNMNKIPILKEIKVPYIQSPSNKKYSLVLDLDETLIFVKFGNNNKGIIYYRPFLIDFLECLFPLYELISFTTATKIYAEPILNSIESNKKYFSFKFYREHAIIKNNNFIKDISLIGRDMSKILLIDNMQHNLNINKENGILIYPFYDEKNLDYSLLELKKILIKIYYKNYNDIREAINDFKNEIIMNVSCNSNNYNNSINI